MASYLSAARFVVPIPSEYLSIVTLKEYCDIESKLYSEPGNQYHMNVQLPSNRS